MAYYTDSTVFEKDGSMTWALRGEIQGWASTLARDIPELRVYDPIFSSVDEAMAFTNNLRGDYFVALRYYVGAKSQNVLELEQILGRVRASRTALLEEHAPWRRVNPRMYCPDCRCIHSCSDLYNEGRVVCRQCGAPLYCRTVREKVAAMDNHIMQLQGKIAKAIASEPGGRTAWYVECTYIGDYIED